MKTLTQAVFDLPECPLDAESALVDSDGHAYWSNFTVDRFTTDDRQYIPDCTFEHRGKWIGGGYDTTNWQESAINREY